MSSFTENSSDKSCEHERIIETLRSIPHFSDLKLEALKVVGLMCNNMNYQPDSDIFVTGDNDDKAYYIVEGVAEVIRKTDEGEVIVGVMEQGSFIGALALLADVKRLFSLRAKTPLKCLVIPRKRLAQVLSQPGTGFDAFLRNIASSIVSWEDTLLRSGSCKENSLGTTGVSLL